MKLTRHDQALIFDIRTAAAEAVGFIHGMKEAAFLKDLKTQRAVERELELVGEAAKGLSENARAAWPEIPFNAMTGMRNILIHEYGKVDPKRVWQTVKFDLPEILKKLK